MRLSVHFYRARCFQQPKGPWRMDRDAARRDAIDQKLGAIDEWGRYFDTVPGNIQIIELETHLLRQALAYAEGASRRVA